VGLVVTYYMPADASSGPWTEDLSGAIRLSTIAGIIDEAELGSVGQSSLLFDDPLGTLGTSHYSDGIRGLKRIWIDETACPAGDQRLFTGWIYDRRYQRGTDSLIIGVARKLDASLADANVMLSFRVFAPVNGSNATQYNASNSFIRPAETDLVRVAALLTVPFLTSVHDTGFISTGAGVDMDACDYTGQHAADVLNDCAQQSGRNFFIRFDETANEFSLHYVDEDDLTDAATLRISNVLADVDGVTTFAPEPDAELVRDPSRISAAVYLPFNGAGSPAYQTRIQTEYDYGWRDSSAPSANVKTLATANVRAARYLLTTDTEDDRITCTLKLSASVVTGIKAGQVVQAKFSHLPNGLSATWGSDFQPCRVLNRNVMANEMTNALYNVRLELSPMQALACSYVAPNFPGHSSLDVLGGSYFYGGYTPASPVYAATSTFVDTELSPMPSGLYGTPNDGGWGITAGVMGAIDHPTRGWLEARWTWDLLAAGSPSICALLIDIMGGIPSPPPGMTVETSNNGMTWVESVSNAELRTAGGSLPYSWPISLPNLTRRYWALVYRMPVSGSGLWYYPGIDINSFLIWGTMPAP